ncbi:TPA: hypothetical protein DEQ95_04425 [Candidatus Beckwithbacteria bacterium]|nr:MAG: hypothetical protein UY43_C0001G0098 [Candidatus Beckwithbacteria bacterium GW2011_GWC1_49_16]OGD48502.1 MAG: hypothetical protein A2877_02010 [Candidatus Beckwithbacteria bacterium RIFCSPHIGHO2_01_FULL_49_39]OGD50607.1 MAG: hypothetical protein A3D86_00675 [Candidatus Beckwithbacteria bacterium RIFCSPHIGHO2_02_FULL_49_13]OGD51423.1 MAG: hypothetical protein A3K56_04255 [Candidatus Beckwithbacteria bacterium RIFCSPHIGHO2_12_FULL_49_13]OGD58517.1 MAG: hypothetical protein A3J22_05090 [Ca
MGEAERDQVMAELEAAVPASEGVVMNRAFISFLDIEGFDDVPDDQLEEKLREWETMNILRHLHRDLMAVGETQSEAAGLIGGVTQQRFVNISRFITTVLNRLVVEKPELGDDLPAYPSEGFFEASVLDILRTVTLNPGHSLNFWVHEDQNSVLDWDDWEQRHNKEERVRNEFERETGVSYEKVEHDEYFERLFEFAAGKLDKKSPAWWQKTTRTEEKVIMEYLHSRAKLTAEMWETEVVIRTRLETETEISYPEDKMRALKIKAQELKDLSLKVCHAESLEDVLSLGNLNDLLTTLNPNFDEIARTTYSFFDS